MRGRDGHMKRSYILNYEWGESWEITADNFDWDRDYWYSVIARNIQYYREHTTKVVQLITYCAISRIVDGDDTYIGMVSVGEHSGYVIVHDGDNETNIELEKESFK